MSQLPASPDPGPRRLAFTRLRRIITEGGFAHGAELPSGRELALTLGIPQATIFRALSDLESAGVVERTPWGSRRVVGVTGLAADLAGDAIPAGGLSGTVVVGMLGTVLFRQAASGWADRAVIGALERVTENGQQSLLIHLRQLRENDLDHIIRGRPRGVILPEADHAWHETKPLIRRLLDAGIPVVLGEAHPALPEADVVFSDHADGARQLVDWLHGLGRRELVQFMPLPPMNESRWSVERRRGFASAVTAYGLCLHPAIEFTSILGEDHHHTNVWEVNRSYALGVLFTLFRAAPQIDALLAVTDPDVLMIASALRELGKEPGRDVLLVGYDNYLEEAWETAHESFRPPVTVDKNNYLRGAAMVDLLYRRLGGELPKSGHHEWHSPTLVTRV